MWRPAFIGLLMLFLSCDTAIPIEPFRNSCDVDNPTRNLPWLKEKITSMEKSGDASHFIEQCEYDGQTYFIINNCVGKNFIPAYDCSGNEVCTLSDFNQCAVVTEKRISKKIIWQPDHPQCE